MSLSTDNRFAFILVSFVGAVEISLLIPMVSWLRLGNHSTKWFKQPLQHLNSVNLHFFYEISSKRGWVRRYSECHVYLYAPKWVLVNRGKKNDMLLQWLSILLVIHKSNFSMLSVYIPAQIQQNVYDFIAPLIWCIRAFVYHNKFKFIKITSLILSCK